MNRRQRRREMKARARKAARPAATDPQASFKSALAHQRAGRLELAEAAYREVLKALPGNPGVSVNLAIVLRLAGRPKEGLAYCEQAVAGDPELIEAHATLGALLTDLGRPDEAVGAHQKALSLDPNLVAAHVNLAVAYKALGRFADGIEAAERAVELAPDVADAHNTLGSLYQAADRLGEAEACYRRCLELAPGQPQALVNLGVIFALAERYEEAVALYERAIAAAPGDAAGHRNLGAALVRLERLDEAVRHYRRSLEIEPDNAEVLINLGNALRILGQPGEAIDVFRQALEIEPDDAEAHLGLGVTQLLTGELEAGWDNYAWRWRAEQMAPERRRFAELEWDGGDLAGKTILVWSEQGIGDEIMFATCLPDLLEQARPESCLLECDARLVGLYARTFPELTVVSKGAPPPFDVQAPIGDLPRIYRRRFEDFPKTVRHLIPDPEQAALWGQRLDELGDGLKVGIAWRGGGYSHIRLRRSVSSNGLRPLLATGGVQFVNLQYGECAEEIAAIAAKTGVVVHDWPDADPLTDIEGQAAQIAGLDLVIQASNASAHLAGALGVAVWNLVPFSPDYRWFLGRDDSPWYPSMRLFRQPAAGDWTGAVEAAAAALEERVSARGAP